MPTMNKLLADSAIDTLRMIPFLLVVYALVEWIEYRYGESIQLKMRDAASAGPLVGALFGCIPQCGFSVLASAMYCRRFLTIGTLLAVYLSTSDEAIPVILAQPDKISTVVPLLVAKVIISLIGGYGADLLLKSRVEPHTHVHEDDHDCEDLLHQTGCCEHDISDGGRRRQMIIHPIVHTAKVAAFVFAVTFGISYGIWKLGEANLSIILLQRSALQPVITAFVGLIPNCAASVAITQVFLKGHIGFGSAISGLCASGGLGILVLLKENHNLRDTARVLGLLLGISIAAGMIVRYTFGW